MSPAAHLKHARLIAEAVKAGDSGVLPSLLVDAPWGLLAHTPGFTELIVEAAGRHQFAAAPHDKEAIEDALHMFVGAALAAQWRQVLRLRLAGNWGFVEPIASLIRADFHRVLQLFIENGFDPTEPYGAQGCSATHFAAGFLGKNETATWMRSVGTRSKVESLIDAITSQEETS